MAAVADWAEDREPEWMVMRMDETVNQVLRHVEMIAAGVGVPPMNAA